MECDHNLISDLAIVAEGSVLLVKYQDMEAYDNEEGWFLPDDVLQHLEHPTRAAKRIAKEQVGLDLEDLAQTSAIVRRVWEPLDGAAGLTMPRCPPTPPP